METQLLYTILAQQQSAPSGGAPSGPAHQDCASMIFLFVPMILIFYFLLIRPQQKQQKKHRQMLSALKKGDRIITNAGIFGTITGIAEGTATIEVAKNVHLRLLVSHIAGLQPMPGEKASETAPVLPDGPNK